MRLGRMTVAIVLALAGLLIPLSWASQIDERLDVLFARLKTTDSEAEAVALTYQIWVIWRESESDAVNVLMARGIEETSRRDYQAAVSTFSEVIEREPDLAEGWNRRATAYYLMGKYEASVRDIERTLALEPRHFGALSGLGFIYLRLGDDRAALDAFEAALEINPYLPGARAQADKLRRRQGRKSI